MKLVVMYLLWPLITAVCRAVHPRGWRQFTSTPLSSKCLRVDTSPSFAATINLLSSSEKKTRRKRGGTSYACKFTSPEFLCIPLLLLHSISPRPNAVAMPTNCEEDVCWEVPAPHSVE